VLLLKQGQFSIPVDDGKVLNCFYFINNFLGWNSPAGQMYSSGGDLAKFMAFFLLANDNKDTDILKGDLLKEMLLPVFVNPDGETMFGTPWEIAQQHGYLVRRKGGNVSGFSTLFSVIPELQLGLSILFNGEAGEFYFSDEAYEILIPAFIETLLQLQPIAPLPSNVESYVGNYSAGSIVMRIKYFPSEQLLELIATNADVELVSVLLAWDFDDTFHAYIPDGLLTCVDNDLIALSNEYVIFGRSESGSITSLQIPGYVYGIVFQK